MAVARGAGPMAELTRGYRAFAATCGFKVDAGRPAMGSDKGKVEQGVSALRGAMREVRRGAGSPGELEERLLARWEYPARQRFGVRIETPPWSAAGIEAPDLVRAAESRARLPPQPPRPTGRRVA